MIAAPDLSTESSPSSDESAPASHAGEAPPRTSTATDVPAEWRARVAGTLINPETLLATDYLNHFNEAAMILGMIPDIPEMFADLEAWRPKSYVEHFSSAGFDYGPLAAEAYAWVPAGVKQPFEAVVDQISLTIRMATKRMAACMAAGDVAVANDIAATASATLTALIGIANSIIAGSRSALTQEDVDELTPSGLGGAP